MARHWARHYRPDTLVVAATGHVDHDRLLEQLGPAGAPPDERFAAPADRPHRHGRAGPTVDGSPGPRAGHGGAGLSPVPASSIARRYPLGLLSLIVGGGMSSRLFVEVRERRGLTYGIDAGETTYTDAGLWTVDWQCAPERLGEIVDIVRAILLDVAEHGVRPDELARAKGQMRGQTDAGVRGTGEPDDPVGRQRADRRRAHASPTCWSATTP